MCQYDNQLSASEIGVLHFFFSAHFSFISKPPISMPIIRYYDQISIIRNPLLENIGSGPGRKMAIVTFMSVGRSFGEVISSAEIIDLKYLV